LGLKRGRAFFEFCASILRHHRSTVPIPARSLQAARRIFWRKADLPGAVGSGGKASFAVVEPLTLIWNGPGQLSFTARAYKI
jgi:hypothetical protein